VKKVLITLVTILTMLVLTACGGEKNPLAAAKIFMTSLVEEDIEMINKMNHSNKYDTDYIMTVAKEVMNIDGQEINDFKFEVTDYNPNEVVVHWYNQKGEPFAWNLRFDKEQDGKYYLQNPFTNIGFLSEQPEKRENAMT